MAVAVDMSNQNDAGFCTEWDFNNLKNNIIVNNGTNSLGVSRFGINWFHVGHITGGVAFGVNNLSKTNLVYGNKPHDMAHHDKQCGTDAAGSTAVTGIPISGNDGDGNAGGCPATNFLTDSGGVTQTFINFQDDQNNAPAASYQASNYKLKAGSHAILGGSSTADCAPSPGTTPCAPSIDFAQTARPTGAQDVGAWAFTTSGVPIVNFSPSPVNFGTVAVSATVSATAVLQNTGSANLTFPTATISGTNAADFSIHQYNLQ